MNEREDNLHRFRSHLLTSIQEAERFKSAVTISPEIATRILGVLEDYSGQKALGPPDKDEQELFARWTDVLQEGLHTCSTNIEKGCVEARIPWDVAHQIYQHFRTRNGRQGRHERLVAVVREAARVCDIIDMATPTSLLGTALSKFQMLRDALKDLRTALNETIEG